VTAAAARVDSVTRALAEFASQLRYEDIPGDVRSHMRLCLLDSVGCGLFGSTLPWTTILRTTLEAVDPHGTCAVIGTEVRLSPPSAALVNGAAIHGFELDDLHKESILHPGSVVVPAAFAALGLRSEITGADLLTAVVAGYEVGARVGMSLGTPHLLQGWHPTGTHGTFAAAAAVANLLRLDPKQTQHALGAAGSQSAGLMAAQFSSMVKRFHAGRAAQSGLYAAMLAANGYTGITDILENEYGGYATTFSPSHDLGRTATELGQRWETSRVGLKPYSTNGSCHVAIDLLTGLRASDGVAADDVDSVRLYVSSATMAHVGWPYSPDSVTTAQMNLPYIAAVVLTDGEAFVDQFTEDRIADPALVELANRVVVTADPAIDAQGPGHRHHTRVELVLRSGRVLTGERNSAKGSQADPITESEARAKYRRLAGHALEAERVASVEELVDSLDALENAAVLPEALTPIAERDVTHG